MGNYRYKFDDPELTIVTEHPIGKYSKRFETPEDAHQYIIDKPLDIAVVSTGQSLTCVESREVSSYLVNIDGKIYLYPNEIGFIDFNFPSGTLWAKHNIGASSIYDVGNFYQWASKKPLKIAEHAQSGQPTDERNIDPFADWKEYPYAYIDKTGNVIITKYGANDDAGNEVLEEDDVAREQTGGVCKTPTYEQIKELMLNTEHKTITLQHNGKNVKGMVFYKKNTTYTEFNRDTMLFLPYGGLSYKSDDGSKLLDVGNSTMIWGSTSGSTQTAYYMQIQNDFISGGNIMGKYAGANIRPVCVKVDPIPEKTRFYSLTSGTHQLAYIQLPHTSINKNTYNILNDAINVTKIIVGSDVKRIESGTFSKFKNLETIIISNTVQYIDPDAFYIESGEDSYPSKLKTIKIIGSTEYDFETLNHPKTLKIKLGNDTSATLNMWEYKPTVLHLSNNTDVIIPTSAITNKELTQQIVNTYKGNNDIVSVEIGANVTNIGNSAFRECSSLTSVTIGNNVTNIETAAFYNCTNLTSIEIPDSVTSIGGSAFSGCTGLTYIEIPSSVTSIGGSAFLDCNNLTKIVIPDNVQIINTFTFAECGKLNNMVLGGGITQIKEHAFDDCKNLKNMTCKAETPPSFVDVDSTFDSVTAFNNGSLRVAIKRSSLSSYQEDSVWGNTSHFKLITPATL